MGQFHLLPRLDLERGAGQTGSLSFHLKGQGIHLPAAVPWEGEPPDVPGFGQIQAVMARGPIPLLFGGLQLRKRQITYSGTTAGPEFFSVHQGGGVEGKTHGAFHFQAKCLFFGEIPGVVVPRGQTPFLHKGFHCLWLHLAAKVHHQGFPAGVHPRHHPVAAGPIKLPGKGQLDPWPFPAAVIPKACLRGDIPLHVPLWRLLFQQFLLFCHAKPLLFPACGGEPSLALFPHLTTAAIKWQQKTP